MSGELDYIIAAFFAAFLGLKFVQTRATGHLWFLLPLLLVIGLNQGWGNILGDTAAGRVFFVLYRLATVGSCALAGYMYYRDYHKRKADAIAENKKVLKQEWQAAGKNSGKRKKK